MAVGGLLLVVGVLLNKTEPGSLQTCENGSKGVRKTVLELLPKAVAEVHSRMQSVGKMHSTQSRSGFLPPRREDARQLALSVTLTVDVFLYLLER